MRVIKFRAWDNVDKKWLWHYEDMGGFDIKGEIILMGEYGSGIPLERFLNDVVITQWSGMIDKDGKEIYEGDIVEYAKEMISDDSEELIYMKKRDYVEFRNGWFQASNNYFGWEGEDIICLENSEVVSNIFETPEFLISTKRETPNDKE